MAKFKVENMLQVLMGAQQGRFQAKQQMQGDRQAQQAQLLAILPQMLAQAERRRQAELEPFDMAASAPNQTPESMAQTQAAALAARQRVGALPDMGSIFAQVLGNQKGPVNVDLGAFQPQGGLGAAPAASFRDPRAEADADRVLALKRGLVADQAGQYENQSAFAPFIAKGEIPIRPDISTQVPIPGGRGAMAPANIPGRGERVVPAGAGELVLDKKQRAISAEKQADRENRLKLADKTAERMMSLGGLRLQGQELALYKDVFKNDYSEYGDGARANQNALAAVQSARQLRPETETAAPVPGATPADAQAAFAAPRETSKGARVRQGDEKLEQGDRRLDMKAEEIDLRRSALTDTKQYRDAMLKEKEYDRALKKEIFQGRLSFDKAQAAIKNSLEGKKLALDTFEAHAKVSGKNGKPDPVRTQKAVLLRQRIGRIEGQINKLQTAGSVETAKGLIPHLDALNVEFDRLLATPDTGTVSEETPTTKAPKTLSINGKSVKATYQALLNDLKKSNDPKYKSDPVKWANYYWNQGK